MTQRIDCADGERRAQAVASAFAAVRRGDLVMIPTESVYALATDAFSMRGVAALREAKGYDGDVPLPIMVGSRSTGPTCTLLALSPHPHRPISLLSHLRLRRRMEEQKQSDQLPKRAEVLNRQRS